MCRKRIIILKVIGRFIPSFLMVTIKFSVVISLLKVFGDFETIRTVITAQPTSESADSIQIKS